MFGEREHSFEVETRRSLGGVDLSHVVSILATQGSIRSTGASATGGALGLLTRGHNCRHPESLPRAMRLEHDVVLLADEGFAVITSSTERT